MPADVALAPLALAEVPALSALWQGQRPDYLRHFRPFGASVAELQHVLAAARQDRFWALRCTEGLAGFCMLRGWDAGYSQPAFGVLVGEEYAGRGLAAAALEFCIAWCRTAGVPGMMLSVSPENERARRLYLAAGFHLTGEHASTGNEILRLTLHQEGGPT